MINTIKKSEIPEGTEIINEKSYDTDKTFIFSFFPDTNYLVYTLDDDLQEALDVFADYCEEKGYAGYIAEKPEDYFDEESENYQYMQDFYTVAGNHCLVIQMPNIVQEVK